MEKGIITRNGGGERNERVLTMGKGDESKKEEKRKRERENVERWE